MVLGHDERPLLDEQSPAVIERERDKVTLMVGWSASQCGSCFSEVALANVCEPVGRGARSSCGSVFEYVAPSQYSGCDSAGLRIIAERFNLEPLYSVDDPNVEPKTDEELEAWVGRSIVGAAPERAMSTNVAALRVTPFSLRCGQCKAPVEVARVCTPTGFSVGRSCGAEFVEVVADHDSGQGLATARAVAARIGVGVFGDIEIDLRS